MCEYIMFGKGWLWFKGEWKVWPTWFQWKLVPASGGSRGSEPLLIVWAGMARQRGGLMLKHHWEGCLMTRLQGNKELGWLLPGSNEYFFPCSQYSLRRCMAIDFMAVEDGLFSYPYLVGVFQSAHWKEGKTKPTNLHWPDILLTEKNLLSPPYCIYENCWLY